MSKVTWSLLLASKMMIWLSKIMLLSLSDVNVMWYVNICLCLFIFLYYHHDFMLFSRGCDCFLFRRHCLHPPKINCLILSGLSLILFSISTNKNGRINESFFAYCNIALGIGLILHSETWYYLDILAPRYSLTSVAKPLKSLPVSLSSISSLLVSTKLIRDRLNKLFSSTISLSAPCIIFTIWGLYKMGKIAFLIYYKLTFKQSMM